MLTPVDLQRQTLRLYGELVCRRPNYGGQLILTTGEGSSATGLPAAVSIAGGTTLAIDPDTAAVKSAFRQGGLDFVVNTLDEALRVLKNEVRQHRPLGVALLSAVAPTLTEMLERGVLADLQVVLPPDATLLFPVVSSACGESQEPASFATAHIHLDINHSPELAAWLAARNLMEAVLPSTPGTSLRTLDAFALSLLPAQDTIRRRWLERISHYQRPSPGGSRVLWLTSAEQVSLHPI
jgi:urocanate hydratase